MNILWFVNVPMPDYVRAKGRCVAQVGGWMESLLAVLRQRHPEVSLSVAFVDQDDEVLEINGVRYFAMKRKHLSLASTNVVDSVAPDIIHYHGSDGIALMLPDEVYSRSANVVSMQEVISGCAPHFMGGVPQDELKRHRNILRDIAGYRNIANEEEYWRTIRSRKESFVLNRAVACLGRTEWDKAWVRYIAPRAKYYHVGEILRRPFYSGRRSGIKIRPHSIYCSAALSYPLKGGHWLLHAVANLKNKYPDVQLRVANAARIQDNNSLVRRFGKNEYYRYIEDLILRLGILGNVVLLPSLSAEEVRDELERAELFCLPSLIENSPNSLGEAMLTGVPSIATNVGGTSSLLRDGIDGVLVPSSDPAMLANAISTLFDNPNLASKYADAGYNGAVVRYAPDRVVQDLMVAYDACMRLV